MIISRIFSLFMLFKLFSNQQKSANSIKLIIPFNFISVKIYLKRMTSGYFGHFLKSNTLFINSKILKFNFLKSGSMIKSNIYYKCFFGDECIW